MRTVVKEWAIGVNLGNPCATCGSPILPGDVCQIEYLHGDGTDKLVNAFCPKCADEPEPPLWYPLETGLDKFNAWAWILKGALEKVRDNRPDDCRNGVVTQLKRWVAALENADA